MMISLKKMISICDFKKNRFFQKLILSLFVPLQLLFKIFLKILFLKITSSHF